MTTFKSAQQVVEEAHPTARMRYNSDTGRFSVYETSGMQELPLSGEWESQSMAWHEAAKRVLAAKGLTCTMN